MVRFARRWSFRSIILSLFAVLIGGCATPRQRYTIDAPIVDGVSTGLNIAHDAHKVSDQEFTTLRPLADRALSDVNAAYIWIGDNPVLADTPSAPCPPLDDLRGIIVSLLPWRLYTTGWAPVLPPSPTTKP